MRATATKSVVVAGVVNRARVEIIAGRTRTRRPWMTLTSATNVARRACIRVVARNGIRRENTPDRRIARIVRTDVVVVTDWRRTWNAPVMVVAVLGTIAGVAVAAVDHCATETPPVFAGVVGRTDVVVAASVAGSRRAVAIIIPADVVGCAAVAVIAWGSFERRPLAAAVRADVTRSAPVVIVARLSVGDNAAARYPLADPSKALVRSAKRIATFVSDTVTVVVEPVAILPCTGIDKTARVVAVALTYAEAVLVVVLFTWRCRIVAVVVDAVAELRRTGVHVRAVVGEGDVGVQQCQAHFAQSFGDIGLVQ